MWMRIISVGLAAVENVITQGDLANRTLYLELDAVQENERRTEPEYWGEFDKVKGEIFGALLSAMSEGLKRLPTIKTPSLPRLATLAQWVTACEAAVWEEGTFLKIYRSNAQEGSGSIIEFDRAVSTFCSFMATRTQWEGTMTALLEALWNHTNAAVREAASRHGYAVENGATYSETVTLAQALQEEKERAQRITRDSSWPKNGRWLSTRLKKSETQLPELGITIKELPGHTTGRKVQITRVKTESEKGAEDLFSGKS
jgi:hypothetical protein